MEQGRMNVRYNPYVYLSSPSDIDLVLVIVLLLWSRHLRSYLRWHLLPLYASAHVDLLGGSPALGPGPENPACIESNDIGSPPQGH
jgi:hypothetical protein